jgi:hypothetical protein
LDKLKLEDVLKLLRKEHLQRNITYDIKERYTEYQALIETESGISKNLAIKKSKRKGTF